mmetsp:Transcript_3184/g.8421  ORF Transcript_3184/g.8421 Transcript_3184/m.8421 type:complete len:144 (+) Transcript_3184:312-743(+)|eukprot:scaffold156623_cov27-Tisochrysis_lutea.AAC.1
MQMFCIHLGAGANARAHTHTACTRTHAHTLTHTACTCTHAHTLTHTACSLSSLTRHTEQQLHSRSRVQPVMWHECSQKAPQNGMQPTDYGMGKGTLHEIRIVAQSSLVPRTPLPTAQHARSHPFTAHTAGSKSPHSGSVTQAL